MPFKYGLYILGKCFFNSFGYKNLNDFLHSIWPDIATSKLTVLSYIFCLSSVVTVIDIFFGIPTRLMLSLVGVLIFEFVIGVGVNIVYCNEEFQPRKALRFIFRTFVFLILLSLLHSTQQGFMLMEMSSVSEILVHGIFESLFLTFLILMFYVSLAGASESGAKAGWKLFIIMHRILTAKIKGVEDKASQ